MRGIYYHYNGKRYDALEVIVDIYTGNFNGVPVTVDIVYNGVSVGHIDINRLCVEVNRRGHKE